MCSCELSGGQALQVRIGLPVEHNEYSSSTICWRYCNIKTNNKKWDQVCSMLDAYAARAVNLCTMFNDTGMKQSLEKILRDAGHKVRTDHRVEIAGTSRSAHHWFDTLNVSGTQVIAHKGLKY